MVAWPSGLRRWFKAPVISMAWVRIPPLPRKSVFFGKTKAVQIVVSFPFQKTFSRRQDQQFTHLPDVSRKVAIAISQKNRSVKW